MVSLQWLHLTPLTCYDQKYWSRQTRFGLSEELIFVLVASQKVPNKVISRLSDYLNICVENYKLVAFWFANWHSI